MNDVKFTGILKLSLDDCSLSCVKTLWTKLPSHARPLAEENLHVTLIHQTILKPVKHIFAGLSLPKGPTIELDDTVLTIVRPDRTSWLALVKNQTDMRTYVEQIQKILLDKSGSKIDLEDRVFHVSLANLTGSPFSSVGDVRWNDIPEQVRLKVKNER